jgi:hypothetical protein
LLKANPRKAERNSNKNADLRKAEQKVKKQANLQKSKPKPQNIAADLGGLGTRVLDKMLATHAWAEKKGLPGVAILASAFETSVNILAYEKGRLPVAKLLDELAAGLRRGELPAHGWVLKRLD